MGTNNKKISRIILVFTSLSVFFIGFWLSSFFYVGNTEEISSPDFQDSEFIQFIFIGSSTCSFSDNEEIINMIDRLIQEFESISVLHGKSFISTGISTDSRALNGIDYLKKTGTYNEIISGISWYNTGLLHYIWDPQIGYASTPQILILSGEFEVISSDFNIFDINKNTQVLKRYRGLNEIRNLYELAFYSDTEKIADELLLNLSYLYRVEC